MALLGKGITVKRLLELLNELPPEQLEYTVVAEGCDCSGDAFGIRVYDRMVEVVRSEY